MNYDVNNYNQTYGSTTQSVVASAMKKVYVKMTLALIVTGLVSFFCSVSETYMTFCATHRWFMWALIIAELAMVFGISAGINKLPSATATGLFYLFAVVNGLMLAPIFIV